MLNFDEQRYIRIQSGAAATAGQIHAAIQACLRAGAENLFFLGTGGAAILMQPAAQLLQRRSQFPGLHRHAGRAGADRIGKPERQFDRRHSLALGHDGGKRGNPRLARRAGRR